MSGPHASGSLRTLELLPPGKLVLAGKRLLAGVGNNAHRAWVFPLCTPKGMNVLQEHSFDHPFHNGVFVGQAAISRAGMESNFWAVHADPRQADNPLMKNLGSILHGAGAATEEAADGVRFSFTSTWIGCDGKPCLDEDRSMVVRQLADAVLVEVLSVKRASYGELRFGATKAGSIAARIQPQLLPALGGEVIACGADQSRRSLSAAGIDPRSCEAVAYENELPGGGRFGCCLCAAHDSSSQERSGPWFVRDYGLAAYAPLLDRSLELRLGGTWTTGLRVVAYDGAIDPERVRRWSSA